MLRLLFGLGRHLGRGRARLLARWYRWRFSEWERSQFAHLEVGRPVSFNVRVRGAGCGRIRIGSRNCFGEAAAYRLGNGEIMLYAAQPHSEIVIGNGNFINNHTVISALERVSIGDDCLIGDFVSIMDCDFHDLDPKTRRTGSGARAPVVIGNNVWLATGVTVMKGVTIGDNSVVGARSVLTRSIPANCVAAGNPAKVIRTI